MKTSVVLVGALLLLSCTQIALAKRHHKRWSTDTAVRGLITRLADQHETRHPDEYGPSGSAEDEFLGSPSGLFYTRASGASAASGYSGASGATGATGAEEELITIAMPEYILEEKLFDAGVVIEDCRGCVQVIGDPSAAAAIQVRSLLLRELDWSEYGNVVVYDDDMLGPSATGGATGPEEFRFKSTTADHPLEDRVIDDAKIGRGFNPELNQVKEPVIDAGSSTPQVSLLNEIKHDASKFKEMSDLFTLSDYRLNNKFIPFAPHLSTSIAMQFFNNHQLVGSEQVSTVSYARVSFPNVEGMFGMGGRQLTKVFKNAVDRLKNTPFSKDTQEDFFDFFRTFGTHVFDSVVYGGAIHIVDEERYSQTKCAVDFAVNGDADVKSKEKDTQGSKNGRDKQGNYRKFNARVHGGKQSELSILTAPEFTLSREQVTAPDVSEKINLWARSVSRKEGRLSVPIEYSMVSIDNFITQNRAAFREALDVYNRNLNSITNVYTALKENQQELTSLNEKAERGFGFIGAGGRMKEHRRNMVRAVGVAIDLHRDMKRQVRRMRLEGEELYKQLLNCAQRTIVKSIAALQKEFKICSWWNRDTKSLVFFEFQNMIICDGSNVFAFIYGGSEDDANERRIRYTNFLDQIEKLDTYKFAVANPGAEI
eukprot:GILI01003034.1.p2 GENE.GILI01003034.1~~GILI01003034.1.p2  ORF type:complete len:653 (-),score=249.82 GILI01003034.1:116-2074(-)